MFEVGEKVVCIIEGLDMDHFCEGLHKNIIGIPEFMKVYVIEDVEPFNHPLCNQYLWLVGSSWEWSIANPPSRGGHYPSNFFRKLSEMQAEARARHSKPENITES